jgi:hypothetical protein
MINDQCLTFNDQWSMAEEAQRSRRGDQRSSEEVGGWKLEVAVRGWRLEVGGWRLEGGNKRGKWRK